MATFRTKARAVDLLGKQQIRDEVTAISELLRNSYDADASEGIIDVDTKKERIFVWDDGEGMTEEDLLEKWLTLGTYDKYKKEIQTTKKGRTKIGEKGIGRLAISLLGNQLFLASKSSNTNTWAILFLHWELFRNENTYLEDIIIPTKSFNNFHDLQSFLINHFDSMKDILLSNLKNDKVWTVDISNKIRDDIETFRITDEVINWLTSIDKRGSGTLFHITKLDNTWDWNVYNTEIKDTSLKRRAQRMKDIIYSFTNILDLLDVENLELKENDNRFTPKIHIDGNKLEDQVWFNAEDLKLYDYSLHGIIENGFFNGEASIRYSKNKVEIIKVNDIPVTQGIYKSAMKDCGPIKIKWFFLEGLPQLSSLSKDKFDMMMGKLNEMGGIFVFRDGLRILPYGEPGNDFLNIEFRRTLGAGYYLFSHRRMFGYMEISKRSNPYLIDKSSREGFIENKEFNYFRKVGENLLIWWAVDFLESPNKDEGRRAQRNKKLSDEYNKQQVELERKKQEEKNEKIYFRDLEKRLNNYSEEITKEFAKIIKEIDNEISRTKNFIISKLKFRESLIVLDGEIFKLKKELLGLLEPLNRLYIEHNKRYYHPNEILDLIERCNDLINEKKDKLNSYIDYSLEKLREEMEEKINSLPSLDRFALLDSKLRQALDWLQENLPILEEIEEKQTKQFLDIFNTTIEKMQRMVFEEIRQKTKILEPIFSELRIQRNQLIEQKTKLDSLEHFNNPEELSRDIEDILSKFENTMKTAQKITIDLEESINQSMVLKRSRYLIENFANNLTNLNYYNPESDNEFIGLLKKEVNMYRDLSAVGLAAELTSHEFNALYANIRDNMKYLFNALQTTPAIPFLEQVRKSFESLERLHQRMSPLYRQIRYRKKELNLHMYIKDVLEYFSSDLEKYEIETIVDVPKDIIIKEIESVLFTPLINMVSNSIYWLLDQNIREIYFYMSNDLQYLYVHDTGPGVSEKDRVRIFEPYFTRKTEGRGLGLYLSRDILESKGYELDLAPLGQEPRPIRGACFFINFKGNAVRSGLK